MFFRQYLATIIFISLLIWGPIDHSMKGWLIIRSSYLILIPLLIYFLLGWIWNIWEPSKPVENILERTLSGLICIALIITAIFEATSDMHLGNTKWIQTRDGMEAVGDDIIVSGPSWGNVLIILLISILVFWFGVLKKHIKNSKVK